MAIGFGVAALMGAGAMVFLGRIGWDVAKMLWAQPADHWADRPKIILIGMTPFAIAALLIIAAATRPLR